MDPLSESWLFLSLLFPRETSEMDPLRRKNPSAVAYREMEVRYVRSHYV